MSFCRGRQTIVQESKQPLSHLCKSRITGTQPSPFTHVLTVAAFAIQWPRLAEYFRKTIWEMKPKIQVFTVWP